MKTIIFMCFSLLLTGTLPAAAAKRYSDDLYKDVISRHCKAVEREKSERYTDVPQMIARGTIKIRSVRALSRGWLRIHAFGNAGGRTVHGYVDYNPRSRQVSCPEGNWIYGPRLPLWPILESMFRINK